MSTYGTPETYGKHGLWLEGEEIETETRDAILAGLRLLQHFQDGTTPDAAMIEEIRTNGGEHAGMDNSNIDIFCESINL